MYISRIRIRNFRSIRDLTLDMGNFMAFCGPNSSGKSNVIQAIRFAFQKHISSADIYNNMSSEKRDAVGSPGSIFIDITLSDCPKSLTDRFLLAESSPIPYSFAARKGGRVSYSFNNKIETDINFLESFFNVIFVPPIRDLTVNGLQPFKEVLADALRRARGDTSLKTAAEKARYVLKVKGDAVLSGHQELAKKLLKVDKIELDTRQVDIEGLYETVTLTVNSNGQSIALENLGTGHQSAVIMNFYRQLGDTTPGEKIYLVEEPDNHLHPSTIRAIGRDLKKTSGKAQVIVTTHSPILLQHFGLDCIQPLYLNDKRHTDKRKIDLTGYSGTEIRSILNEYGVRATEPLLCRRVVVVEGACDAQILSQLIERRYGNTPDQLDILIIVAGGKAKTIKLCTLLEALGVEWRVVFDFDAALRDEAPYLKSGLSTATVSDIQTAVGKIRGVLNTKFNRGKEAQKHFKAIEKELTGGPAGRTCFEGSTIEKIADITKTMSAVTRAQLKSFLTKQSKTKYQPLLTKSRIWLWSGTIEDVITSAAGSVDKIETTLISLGKLTGPVGGSGRTEHIKGILHNCANEPGVLSKVVDDLEDAKKLGRTEITPALQFLTHQII